MNRFCLLLAAVCVVAPLCADEPPLAGRFCVIETKASHCRDTTGATLVLQSEEKAGKLFTWTRSDEQLVIAGTVPKTETLDLASLPAATIGLPLVMKAPKSVAVRSPLTFTLLSRERNWQWEMTPSVVNRKAPVMLRLDPGEYALTIAANKLLPLASGRFEVRASAHDLAAREFHFRELPIVSGIVRAARSQAPLAGVTVMSEGLLLATTDADGRFHYAATKSGDTSLELSRSGYAAHFMSIVVPTESTELDPIFLDRGSTLRIEVKTADPLERPSTADLYKINPNHVVKIRSTAAARFATFERVESGDYVLVLNGSGALQHLATQVSVEPGASVVEGVATIKPLVLSGSIHLGDTALADAQISISDSAYRIWSGDVRPQPDGTFSETVWDRSFRAVISSPQLEQSFIAVKAIRSNFEAFWDIVIPAGRIVGRVHDKEGQPVPRPKLRYSFTGGGTVFRNRSVEVRDDGGFTISAAGKGDYVIECTGEGYLPADPLRLSLDDTSANRTVDIALAKSDAMTLQVSQYDGEPVHDALVVLMAANNASLAAPLARTDGFGEVHLVRPKTGERLFVLSSAGPWSEVAVPADADPSTPFRVLLPRCDVRLHVRAIDVSGRPISGASFFVRYNGTIIPPQIWSFLADMRMASASTTAAGDTTFGQMPAGMYAIVPFVNPSELRIAAAQKKWPVETSLAAGEADLTLVFEKSD